MLSNCYHAVYGVKPLLMIMKMLHSFFYVETVIEKLHPSDFLKILNYLVCNFYREIKIAILLT